MNAKIFTVIIALLFIAALFAQNSGGLETGSGTGFFITNDGHIITNEHVVDGASRITVRTGGQKFIARVLSKDARMDLALLKIDYQNPKHFRIAPFDQVDLGERIFVLGYPFSTVLGSDIKLTDGIISSRSGIRDDLTRFQMSVPIQPGNSGGPVFNSDFNVIGVAVEKLSDAYIRNNYGVVPQNVNFGVKSNNIGNMLGSVRLGAGNVAGMDDAVRATVKILVLKETLQISVRNNTGAEIWYAYMSPSSESSWGEDILNSDETLQNGATRAFRLPAAAAQVQYDIRLRCRNGNDYVKYRVAINSEQVIDFTAHDLASGTSTVPTTPPPNVLPTVRVINNTGYLVRYLYLSPSSQTTWGNDRLGTSVLADGESFLLNILSRDPNDMYDVMLKDSDGDTYTRMGVLIRQNTEMRFTLQDIDPK